MKLRPIGLVGLVTGAFLATRGHADDLTPGVEGLKLINAQMVRELSSRAARLGTSTGTSDTTFVGYTPGHKGPNNYWSIYSGFGKDGYKRPQNGQPNRGTWDWEEPVNGDSLQGWWPVINQYASTGGLTLSDRVRPWWAIDYGNMANYVINQNNGRTYGVIGVWHRDAGANAPAPAGLPSPAFRAPSGNYAAWMGLRAHGDETHRDAQTGNPFNEDLLQYVGFTSVSATGNDYGFPGYGSQMDQMLYRDINFQGKKTANLTIHFKFNTRMSTGSGNNAITDTGWFDCDPLAFTGGANNPQLNNFISATDAGTALSPRDSFMVYIGAGVDTNLWLGSDGMRRPVYDKQRRSFGEVLHWDRDPNSSPANPQPRFYKELLSVGGNWPRDPVTKAGIGYVDTTFVISNAALQPYLAKNNKIRLVFRVKTNRFFDDMLPGYSSENKGAAIVDAVSYQLGANPVQLFGDFENPSDINNDVDVGAVDAWKSTGKPPAIFHHVHLFSDLVYEDLCGAKGDISRICNMSGIVVSAGDHDHSEAAGGIVDGTAQRERGDGIMSPTIQLAGPYNGPGGVNAIGLKPYTGVDQPGDINPSEDFYVQYELYAGIMDPFTKGNLWRFAIMSYPSPSKPAKGSYPAWGQMRFPGAIFFNPDKECFEDFEGAYQNFLIKTTGAGGIPDSLKIFVGKLTFCYRWGVSTGCSPTDGCYWDNVCLAIVDGHPTQLGVDIWRWIQDAFPANETAGLPGTANFDTAAAIVKTGINIARPTNTNLRFDVPGDSTVIYSSPNTARVDMVFRILPGPGNYNPIGRPDLGAIRRVPSNPAVVTKGDGSFWDQYRQTPGDFACPNAVTLHHNAIGGWDPNVWNSARCDTAEINLAALQPQTLGGPADPSAWMSTYHESDPHFLTLGILKNKCYVRCTTCDLLNRRCDGGQPDDYTVTTGPGGTAGTTTTKEFTKIIPDGLLTPGSHVEYFFRDQKDHQASGPMDGMIPDTNAVSPQVAEGSTDGHRWQEFGVLPDRWKVQTNKHPVTGEFGRGPACMLVFDNNDRRGNERIWVSVSDTIGATPQRYWGAHNGWHARGSGGDLNNPADNLRGKDGAAGWVSEHLGQAGSGSSWDMYQVKASESLSTSAGSPGSRLANRTGTAAQQIVIDKTSRQGPTPAMLNAYYVMMLFLSGDLSTGVLGPYRNRSQNDAGIIINWLQAANTSVLNRGFWAIGDGFAESNIFTSTKLAPFDLMIDYLGVDCFDPNYTFASGDTRELVDYKLQPAWENKPAGQVEIFGIRNRCLWTNDVLKVEGPGVPTLGSVTSHYYGPGGQYAAGVFKDWAPSSPWKSLVDGWDIEHLTGVHDVDTRDRNGYFYKIFVNIWSKLCRVYGTPIIPLEVPTMGDGGLVDFVNLRNNPVVSGSATIHLGLSRADRVEVKIFDVSGRLIRTLADRPFPAGEHDLVWDGMDNGGNRAARGVYFTRVKFRSSGFEGRRKLTVLR